MICSSFISVTVNLTKANPPGGLKIAPDTKCGTFPGKQ
jgi:hypothetical protein